MIDMKNGLAEKRLNSVQVIYIDMDDTIADFRGAHQRAIKANPKVIFPQSRYGFFEGLKPIEHAIKRVKALLADERFDPYVLTAPSIRNPLSYTEKRIWIEQKFGLEFCNRLTISPHKNLLKGGFLIGDFDQGKGQEGFEGELIHFGSARFPDWLSVMEYLLSR
ncbi:MAG: hypothetical protein V7707_09035 [Motiliproteus sp.]